jgi:L-alanine-DL-glutamate epimerase-like enolase superfamily enzyme
MGLYALAFAGMSPFGSLLVGTVAEHFGVRIACAVSGGLGLIAIAALALVATRLKWQNLGTGPAAIPH